MDILVSHQTALSLLRSQIDLGGYRRSRRRRLAPSKPVNVEEARAVLDHIDEVSCGSLATGAERDPSLDLLADEWPSCARSPLSVLVSDPDARRRNLDVDATLWRRPLPAGCVLEPLGQGGRDSAESEPRPSLGITSPELLFVQMGRGMDVLGLIKLGYELCGSYSLGPDGDSFFGRPPLTTVARIKRVVDACKGAYGIVSARQAIAYVLEGSASPLETALGMLLFTPRNLGGYGLPKARLNVRLKVDAATRKMTDKRFAVPDILWPDQREVVECESTAWHTGADRIAEDSHRRTVLSHMGYHVTTITTREIFNPRLLDASVRALALRLGYRMRWDAYSSCGNGRLREVLFGTGQVIDDPLEYPPVEVESYLPDDEPSVWEYRDYLEDMAEDVTGCRYGYVG